MYVQPENHEIFLHDSERKNDKTNIIRIKKNIQNWRIVLNKHDLSLYDILKTKKNRMLANSSNTCGLTTIPINFNQFINYLNWILGTNNLMKPYNSKLEEERIVHGFLGLGLPLHIL